MKLPSLLYTCFVAASLTTGLPSTVDQAQKDHSVREWFLKKANDISLKVYDSPKLNGTVEEIRHILEITTNILESLGLSGPAVENRVAGHCARELSLYTCSM